MRIKVSGKLSPKSLCLLLMKTLAKLNIDEINGASLYFGDGDRVVIASADGSIEQTDKPIKKAAKKKGTSDFWPSKQCLIGTKKNIVDDGTIPWVTRTER